MQFNPAEWLIPSSVGDSLCQLDPISFSHSDLVPPISVVPWRARRPCRDMLLEGRVRVRHTTSASSGSHARRVPGLFLECRK